MDELAVAEGRWESRCHSAGDMNEDRAGGWLERASGGLCRACTLIEEEHVLCLRGQEERMKSRGLHRGLKGTTQRSEDTRGRRDCLPVEARRLTTARQGTGLEEDAQAGGQRGHRGQGVSPVAQRPWLQRVSSREVLSKNLTETGADSSAFSSLAAL